MRKENALIGYAFCKKARARSGRSVGDGAAVVSVSRGADEREPTARKPAAPLRPERSRLISQGALGRMTLQRHILCDSLHIPQDRRIKNPGIVAGHLRIGVSEHFGDVFYGRSACKGQRGERVPRSMGRKVFANTAYIG